MVTAFICRLNIRMKSGLYSPAAPYSLTLFDSSRIMHIRSPQPLLRTTKGLSSPNSSNHNRHLRPQTRPFSLPIIAQKHRSGPKFKIDKNSLKRQGCSSRVFFGRENYSTAAFCVTFCYKSVESPVFSDVTQLVTGLKFLFFVTFSYSCVTWSVTRLVTFLMY